jgi:uncharacterized C2H2 Zn-finger protein
MAKNQEYRCPACGERFRKGKQLERHVEKEHGFDVAAKTCLVPKQEKSQRE